MGILNIVIELDCIGLEMLWLDKRGISLDRTVQRIGWDCTGFKQMGLQGVDCIVFHSGGARSNSQDSQES